MRWACGVQTLLAPSWVPRAGAAAEAEGRALASLSMEWHGCGFLRARRAVFVFHFPPSRLFCSQTWEALSQGQCFAGALSVLTQISLCKAGVGLWRGRWGWEAAGREAGRGNTKPRVCCPWDPGPAHPLRVLHPLDPPRGSMGASCTLRGTSESPSVTKPPELVLGRRACGVPAPPPPLQGESR